jgi:hypothetical protein
MLGFAKEGISIVLWRHRSGSLATDLISVQYLGKSDVILAATVGLVSYFDRDFSPARDPQALANRSSTPCQGRFLPI